MIGHMKKKTRSYPNTFHLRVLKSVKAETKVMKKEVR